MASPGGRVLRDVNGGNSATPIKLTASSQWVRLHETTCLKLRDQ